VEPSRVQRFKPEHLCNVGVNQHSSGKTAKLAAGAVKAIPEAVSIFASREANYQRIRINNMLERLNKELKLRTLVATVFPNGESRMRLTTDVATVISGERANSTTGVALDTIQRGAKND
jgi:transposase-like protein